MLGQEPTAHKEKQLSFLLQTPAGSLPSYLSSSSVFKCAPAEEKGTEVLDTPTELHLLIFSGKIWPGIFGPWVKLPVFLPCVAWIYLALIKLDTF